MINSIWLKFLKDIFICSLGSYGGPEAHYGVMSSILVERKKYLTEEELTEFIGLFALVPGPSSTQTITAIGYYVGGPLLAFLSFLVWVLPAIIIMSLIGVFFTHIDSSQAWEPLITYLPAAAVAFIIYAAFSISRKVLNSTIDWLFYLFILTLGLLFASYSIWIVPVLLILGGFSIFAPGIMLVYFIFPIWKTMTESPKMSHFLRGVTVTAASLIAMTAINQIIKLPADIFSYIILIVATLMLLSKKIPAPIIVLGAAFFGFII